ncbi:hypothetical protein WJX81_004944 [Elliptochloris bilobata]|uniref:Nucleotide-diphospho-sugar transferase domain-containing protein n=1 Tax=Elliptochloris bilobata TaxID=381761 RepID=A0AAW1SLT0_9CHLO
MRGAYAVGHGLADEQLAAQSHQQGGTWDNLRIAPLQQSWETAAASAYADGAGNSVMHAAQQQQQLHHAMLPQQQLQAAAQAIVGHVQRGSLLSFDGSGLQIKLCRRCGVTKPAKEFYKSKANSDGLDGRCKTCDALQCADRRRRKTRVDAPTVDFKPCRRCGITKPASEFYRNKTNPDGLYNNCKGCFSHDAQARRSRMAPLEDRVVVSKQCKRCKVTKSANDFYRNKLMADGLYSHCKQCYGQAANERSAGRIPAADKECRRCKASKPAANFYHSKMTADGLQSYCKACYALAAQQRRARIAEAGGAPERPEHEHAGIEQHMHHEQGAALAAALAAGAGALGPLPPGTLPQHLLAQPDKELRLSKLGFGERDRVSNGESELEGTANDTVLATVVDAAAAEVLLPVFLAALQRLAPPADRQLLVFAVDAAALASCRQQHPQCLARSGRATRAGAAAAGNTTARNGRALLTGADAESRPGEASNQGTEESQAQADAKRAAEQPREERQAQQLAWENVAIAADIAARNRTVLAAAAHTVWLQNPASAVASAAVAAAGGDAVDVLVAASDAPATARMHRLDASLLFARPSHAALGLLEEWLQRRRRGARVAADFGAALAAAQQKHEALQVAELPTAQFASGCCCGAAAAIAAGGWNARSIAVERRRAWAAWQAKCVRAPALQRSAMQSVLDAAAS